MISQLTRSLLEDVDTDQSYRDKAQALMRKLIAWIAKPDSVEHMQHIDSGKFNSGIVFKARWVDPEYNDLLIVMMPSSTEEVRQHLVTGGFGRTPDNQWFVVAIHNLIGPGDIKYAATRINRSACLHELIHYFDAKREKSRPESSKAMLDSGDETGYFNDAGEFNAYFQEMAWSLDNLFKNEHFNALPEYKTWEGFRELAEKEIASSRWVELLSPKYRRKFLKRLHILWRKAVNRA